MGSVLGLPRLPRWALELRFALVAPGPQGRGLSRGLRRHYSGSQAGGQGARLWRAPGTFVGSMAEWQVDACLTEVQTRRASPREQVATLLLLHKLGAGAERGTGACTAMGTVS